MSYINKPIEAIYFSERTRNALIKNNIVTTEKLWEIRNQKDCFFLNMRGIGTKGLKEIRKGISLIEEDFMLNYKENPLEKISDKGTNDLISSFVVCEDYSNGGLYIPIKITNSRGEYVKRQEWKKPLNNYLSEIYKSGKEFSIIEFISIFLKQLSNIEIDSLKYRLHFIGEDKEITLGEIAKKNGVTAERIRQTTISLLDKIKNIFIDLSKTNIGIKLRNGVIDKYNIGAYGILDISNTNSIEYINKVFLAYAYVSLLSNEYDYYFLNEKKEPGDIVLIYKRKSFNNYDLHKAFSQIDKIYGKERTEDLILDKEKFFKKIAGNFFITHNEVCEYCVFQYLLYVCNIVPEGSKIVFPQNKKDKLNSIVVKELEMLNQPIHFGDMYREVQNKYPDRNRNRQKVHHALMSFGKNVGPGLYVKQSHYMIGGTIGDIAESFLQKIGGRVKYSTLVDYVMHHRKTIPSAIYSMLLEQDKEKRFVRLKGGRIGLSAKNFDDVVPAW